MPRRKSRVVAPPGSCALCHKVENHPLLGDVIEKGDLKFHSNCIFASSGLYQEKTDGRTNREYIEGFHIEAIQREIRRGKSLHCAQCHAPGACVGCVVVSCPSSFHLPCLTKAGGVTIFEGPFPSYCKRHAPKQNLDKWLELCTEAPSCCICLFSILSDLPAVTSAKIKIESKHENNLIGSASNSTDTPKSERRLPRRSCMTMSTPKRIRVSVRCDVRRLSSFNSSSWEVSDSLPDPPEPEPDVKSDEPSPTPTYKIASSLNHLPDWLKAQFITKPPHRQISAYDSWAHDTIHGSCCPKAWMHRDCLAGYAASAALHYLKCPYCADKQTFIRSVIAAGIWVPDRDAAWELEPGAYADLVPVENGNESDRTDQSSSSNTSTESSQSSTIVSKSKESTANPQGVREPTQSGRRSVRGQHRASHPDGCQSETADRNSKAILSLVWNNRHLELRGRSGTLLRSRSRRLTPPTIPKSPPETAHRRRYSSRRRSSLFSRNGTLETPTSNHFSESHRLRQATLGSFLANLRVSSPT